MCQSLKSALLGVVVSLACATNGAAQGFMERVHVWEQRLDARIGVVLRDVESDWQISYRSDEAFPMSSTFKPLLCAAVLSRSEVEPDLLTRQLPYAAADLVAYSPVTEQHIGEGMTVYDLCTATMTVSDNTAANLVMREIGGPEAVTHFLRQLGDQTTRLDRWEIDLNEATPGDLRDTTTPAVILQTLEKLLWGNLLSPASAKTLQEWMINDKVADALIRAGLPAGWRIGDKSGAGGYGSRAIIAFLETDQGARYLAAIYLTESAADFATRNKVLADLGQAMIAEIEAR